MWVDQIISMAGGIWTRKASDRKMWRQKKDQVVEAVKL